MTFCPTNHTCAWKLASHLHSGRWQTHQCLKWVRGGIGKLRRETICLQYTQSSVHSITHPNANTISQWASDIQKLGLQRDREKIQIKLNTPFAISPQVPSVNMTWQRISVLLLILLLWGCRMHLQQQVLLRAEVHLHSLLFPSHPVPQLQIDCPSAPTLGYSSWNACLCCQITPLQAP